MTGRHELKLHPGLPYPMGVSVTSDGKVNFAAALHTKEECGVLLYLGGRTAPVRLPFHTGKKIGNIYCMQVEGLEEKDFRYNFYAGEEILTDPYAGIVYGNEHWGKKVSPALKGGYCPHDYDWEEDRPLMTPLSETVLYLVHPRGFTRHASSGVEHKGTFAGIAEKIPYLSQLGITAVELMPSYEFLELEKKPLTGPAGSVSMEEAKRHYMDKPEEEQPRINYWGYKKGYYFAPKFSYSASGHPEEEFKDLVKALHRAGIELIMQFYFPPEVKQAYILEVIRHWVLEYHVDGFHLMGVGIPTALLATEPMLGNTKLFCQDVPCHEIYGKEEIPVYRNLAEYNDGFMYAMRHFLKSDEDALPGALACLRKNPGQCGVINYITNYSGFTLADLVSFDGKHNEENGEENRDGEDYNVSWNCGCEGKTRKKSIQDLRWRQMRNAVLLLLTAQGTPMIVGGDEFGFSRGGNNNPYCQDNQISWLDWRLKGRNEPFWNFVKEAIALRKRHPILHRPVECTMLDYIACGYPDLSYHGEEAWKLKTDRLSRFAGVMYCGNYALKNRNEADSSFYIAYNMHWEPHAFALPGLPEGQEWTAVCDTADGWTNHFAGEDAGMGRAAEDVEDEGRKTLVPGRSIRILRSTPSTRTGNSRNEKGKDKKSSKKKAGQTEK